MKAKAVTNAKEAVIPNYIYNANQELNNSVINAAASRP
jgi:hypothetical protein